MFVALHSSFRPTVALGRARGGTTVTRNSAVSASAVSLVNLRGVANVSLVSTPQESVNVADLLSSTPYSSVDDEVGEVGKQRSVLVLGRSMG